MQISKTLATISNIITHSCIHYRFPQKDLVDAFYVLGMRGINMGTDESAKLYGNTEIGMLAQHFGEEKVTFLSTQVFKFTLISCFSKYIIKSKKYVCLVCFENRIRASYNLYSVIISKHMSLRMMIMIVFTLVMLKMILLYDDEDDNYHLCNKTVTVNLISTAIYKKKVWKKAFAYWFLPGKLVR